MKMDTVAKRERAPGEPLACIPRVVIETYPSGMYIQVAWYIKLGLYTPSGDRDISIWYVYTGCLAYPTRPVYPEW